MVLRRISSRILLILLFLYDTTTNNAEKAPQTILQQTITHSHLNNSLLIKYFKKTAVFSLRCQKERKKDRLVG